MSMTDRYNKAIKLLARTGDFRHVIEALQLIPPVLEEKLRKHREILDKLANSLDRLEKTTQSIEGQVRVLNKMVEELGAEVDGLMKNHEEVLDKIDELSEKVTNLNRRLSHVEMYIGAMTEAILSKIFIDKLTSEKYDIKEVKRNYHIDGEEIDLIVIAEKEGEEKHFIVEIKVKPKRSDVGALLVKAEVYAIKTGTTPIPVLAGTWISFDVKTYAQAKNVLVVEL